MPNPLYRLPVQGFCGCHTVGYTFADDAHAAYNKQLITMKLMMPMQSTTSTPAFPHMGKIIEMGLWGNDMHRNVADGY
jgi:hypothetical protein